MIDEKKNSHPYSLNSSIYLLVPLRVRSCPLDLLVARNAAVKLYDHATLFAATMCAVHVGWLRTVRTGFFVFSYKIISAW